MAQKHLKDDLSILRSIGCQSGRCHYLVKPRTQLPTYSKSDKPHWERRIKRSTIATTSASTLNRRRWRITKSGASCGGASNVDKIALSTKSLMVLMDDRGLVGSWSLSWPPFNGALPKSNWGAK